MKSVIRKKSLLFNRFIKLVEENHQTITEHFMNDLLKNPDTSAYRHVDQYTVYDESDTVYRELSKCITKDFPKEKIAERYKKAGKDLFTMGIPFPQIHKAMVLQKRHLWLFVMEKIYDDISIYNEAIELNNRVALYFDRATHYLLQGYDEMISHKTI